MLKEGPPNSENDGWREFEYALDWLRDERPYQTEKFDYPEQVRRLRENFSEEIDFWKQQFASYMQRLPILPMENPNGRQAAAKFAATAVCFLETVIRAYGELPEPGVPSGENLDTLRRLPQEE